MIVKTQRECKTESVGGEREGDKETERQRDTETQRATHRRERDSTDTYYWQL